MTWIIRHITFTLTTLLLFAACTADTTCRTDMSVAMVISLKADSLNNQGHIVQYTSWDSLSLEILSPYDLLIDNQKGVKKIALPLNPDTSITTFTMTYHNQTDTLYIEHTPRQYFVSLACGCAIYHTITKAWSSDSRVDSVQIINANVENAIQENLRIYLHE